MEHIRFKMAMKVRIPEDARHMVELHGLGIRGRMQAVQELSRSGALNPGAKLAKQKVGTGKRLTSEERAKLKKLREREERRRKREERDKRNQPKGEN